MSDTMPDTLHNSSPDASPYLSSEAFEAIAENKKLIFSFEQSNKSRFFGKLRYWWGWTVAGSLLLVIGIPVLIFLWIINRRMWLYPIGRWGANLWLRSCGARIAVIGLENLAENRSYVFISNHRSYLDTATLFFHAGKKI